MRIDARIGLGIAFGAGSGACWGLVFVAPELAHGFSALQLSAARYLGYGLLAAALIAPRWPRLAALLGRAEWRALVVLSLLGNIFYYVLLALAVQRGGVAMTSLVIGFLPVAVTVIGSRRAGAVPLGRLAPSLALAMAGIVCVGWQALALAGDAPLAGRWVGFVCALGALGSWTAYAVMNARWLERVPRLSSDDWNLLTGVVTGGLALVLALPAFLPAVWGAGPAHGGADWARFVGVAAAVALVASMLGNAFWNRASRLLPLTLVGQMILFETLFALLYGFVWEQRLPTALEAVAMVLVTASVLSCVRAHRTTAAPAHA